MTDQTDIKLLEKLSETKTRFFEEIGKSIIGQKDVLNHILIALLCKGHTLIVGVPGLAKTLMIKSMAELLDLNFSRIQFTPDLMPSDITGTEVIEQNRSTGKRVFRFFKGPVFGNIILADEINRTPPKTQSALLEAMQEYKVTAGGKTHDLDEPFFVLATQNPIEQEGTYPLPEAQLDRFMYSVFLDYPTINEEIDIVKRTTLSKMENFTQLFSTQDILNYQSLVLNITVNDNVIRYSVELVNKTRPNRDNSSDYVNKYINFGAGPRASQYLILGAKIHSLLSGKYSPDIEDVQAVAHWVLAHRLVKNYKAEAEGVTTKDIISHLL